VYTGFYWGNLRERDHLEDTGVIKNAMGGSCSTYGGRGEVYAGFYWGNLRERDHMEYTGVDGRIILR